MPKIKLNFNVLSSTYEVCRLEPLTPIPASVIQGDFYTVSKTQDELSILCQEDIIPLAIVALRDAEYGVDDSSLMSSVMVS